MPKFSKTSKERLETCCPELQEIAHAVIKVFDFTILEGRRGEDRQNYLYKTGASKLRYPKSKHNGSPSLAFDAAPWPVIWSDYYRFFILAGHIQGAGAALGYKIRWGMDWDQDLTYGLGYKTDQKFNDGPHFEYVGPL